MGGRTGWGGGRWGGAGGSGGGGGRERSGAWGVTRRWGLIDVGTSYGDVFTEELERYEEGLVGKLQYFEWPYLYQYS